MVAPAVLATAAAVFFTARSVTPVPEAVSEARAPQVLISPSSVVAAVTPVAPPTAIPARSQTAAPVVARISTSPDVLVAPDEEMALRRWLTHLRSPRVPEETIAAVPAIVPVEIPLIHIEPVPAGQSGSERNR